MADASSLPTCRRSEEHTSELQSHSDIVCRLLLEKTWVTVVPMRTPVKAPGPRPKAMAASAFNDRSAARRRSSTMVRIRSAFFFNDTATPEIYTLSLHDALPILLNEGARWWTRFDAAIDRLLDKSIRRNEPVIHALLVIGLVELEVLELPAYAAVAATVEAVRELRRPRLAGLTNAVLRRWQRERDTLNAALDATPATRHGHPPWLAAAIARDWPEQAEAVLAAANQEPPLMLRVNRNRATREDVIGRLTAAGQAAELHPWLADGVVLPH